MHSLLAKLLEKRGVEDVSKLEVEEKIDYDRMQQILSEGEVTVDKISEFCKNQVKLIGAQWKDLNNSQEKNERLILLHTVYSTLLELIHGPKVQREALERWLTEQLK